ncbi:hypothetical protein [Povalibacter sp.]|uniref:hypothetical protein n=1 Tax=Povalibacter sp. TaxID=1962978 RepID=UPI002F400A58
MNRVTATSVIATLWLGCAASAPAGPLDAAESAYADLNDAYGAISLIDSGTQATYAGHDRTHWLRIYTEQRATVATELAEVTSQTLSADDSRALHVMKDALASLSDSPDSPAPAAKCVDAQSKEATAAALRQSLYGCFAEHANSLQFEGQTVTRVGAFDLLTRMQDTQRRKALFNAFTPLWRTLNGNSEVDSPYRRMIALTAVEARQAGSAIDAAAKTVGATPGEIERWLEQILEAWRVASDSTPIEPWDYRFVHGAAERALAPSIAREAMQPLNERFYKDLGGDLAAWGVLYDLDPRSGKAPLAYTDYVRRGRMVDGQWQPTIARVSGSYAHGGLGLLNELVHENGHAAHMMALHTRPAFMDLGDAVFYEAFADVPSWSVYEPAWQQKYLGRSVAEPESLRGMFATVMLDVAWALFDLRMLRDPSLDPNIVWTQITNRYLHVVPHPELSWWAVRVQLVESPGYMVNYGLGAVITADIRQRTTEKIGAFDAGNVRWFPWLDENLLRTGQQTPTVELLQQFLGRPVSPQALLDQLGRIRSP